MIVLNAKIFQQKIAPALKESLGLKNIHQVPRIVKVSLNAGLGKGLKDARFTEAVEATLTRISGQKPVKTLAKKSISTFKIRQGMPVGMIVTLRGKRMWHFLEKLVALSFPRVRDFRGIQESCVDKQGNFSYGFREQLAFPEVSPEEGDISVGLQVNVTTTATSHEQGMELFRALGVPFVAKSGKGNK
ncbi:MAG: 50S ribosomal protein L5 [Patescibacteria group bacterium]